MKNPVRFLRDEAGRSNAWIMNKIYCSEQSITNWYAGKPIARHFRPILVKLAKAEAKRIAEQK